MDETNLLAITSHPTDGGGAAYCDDCGGSCYFTYRAREVDTGRALNLCTICFTKRPHAGSAA
jgi:hypothetical protein